MKPTVHYDPDKTTTYMADRTTIRALFAIAASMNMYVEHFDITGAYLHEQYQHHKKVFVWQPPRFDGTYKHKSTHGQLKGNLYGTPAAANIYSTHLHKHLKKHGYTQLRSDTSLFIKRDDKDIILIGISMDDFLPVATNRHMIDKLYTVLRTKYKVKRLGQPDTYLNWTIQYRKEGIHISQPQHIDSVVAMLAQHQSNPQRTPYLDGVKVDPPTTDETTREDIADIYGSAVGEIRYIADSTRPDIAFAATALARALKGPTQRHWKLLQRLAQYLHTTRTEGILMPRGTNQGITIHAYSDADYANDETTRKSVTGTITLLNGSPVQWLSRQQPIVTKSTCEAEYIAAAKTATLTIWLPNMMRETTIPTRQPVLHIENTVDVQMAKTPDPHAEENASMCGTTSSTRQCKPAKSGCRAYQPRTKKPTYSQSR